MKIDIEEILDSVKALLLADLNTKIAEIEAEKLAAGKGAVGGLAAVDAEAYFLQSWNEEILNYHPAIFYGIESQQAIPGPVTAVRANIFIDVVFQDDGNRADDTWRRVNRYVRAIKEVIEKNAEKISGASRLQVETVSPGSFRLALDSSEEIKVGGVAIAASFV